MFYTASTSRVRYPVASYQRLENETRFSLLSIQHFGKEHGSEIQSVTRWPAPNCSIHCACTAMWLKSSSTPRTCYLWNVLSLSRFPESYNSPSLNLRAMSLILSPSPLNLSRVISLDISKAFDRVWHKGLLAKLPIFGLNQTLINWIGSFPSDRSIAVRVDGFLSNPHSINAGVPQGSVIFPVLFILFINDLLTPTLSSIYSFADDTFLSSSFSFNPNDHASTDIQLHRNISASLLSNDLTVIEKWGKDNLVSFNQSKTKQAVISRKRNQNFPAVFMNGNELDTSASFTQLGLSLSSNLTWKTHIHSLAKHASQKLGFLARARGFFSPSNNIQVPNPSFFRVLLPLLGWCSKIYSLSSRQSPVQSHSSHQ